MMLKKLSILIMNKLNTVNMYNLIPLIAVFWDNNKQYDISNTMYMQFDDV